MSASHRPVHVARQEGVSRLQWPWCCQLLCLPVLPHDAHVRLALVRVQLTARPVLELWGSEHCLALQVSAAGLTGTVKASVAKQKQLGTQVTAAAIKGAGTTDMLAWLDAKIAARKAALVN